MREMHTCPHLCSVAKGNLLWFTGVGPGAARGHLAQSGSSEKVSWEGFLVEVLPVQAGFYSQ